MTTRSKPLTSFLALMAIASAIAVFVFGPLAGRVTPPLQSPLATMAARATQQSPCAPLTPTPEPPRPTSSAPEPRLLVSTSRACVGDFITLTLTSGPQGYNNGVTIVDANGILVENEPIRFPLKMGSEKSNSIVANKAGTAVVNLTWEVESASFGIPKRPSGYGWYTYTTNAVTITILPR